MSAGAAREASSGRVLHADARALLASLPRGGVDLVYADPPFATGRVQRAAAGAYDDRPRGGMPGYLAWLREVLEHAHAALSSSGSCFLHLDWRAAHHARVLLDEVFGAARFVNEIIWCYSVGGKSPRAFGRKHDTILWYARGPRHAFYPDAVRVPRRAGSHMKVERDEGGAAVQVKRDAKTGKVYRYPVADGKVPEDWWTDIETLNRSDAERVGWPSQKPERLLERVILATTRAGDLVVDPFSGSGTTAAVAHRLERRFVVGDASAEACAVTAKRLAARACVVRPQTL